MKPEGEPAVVVDTNSMNWLATEFSGLSYLPLFEAADHKEHVVLEKLDPDAQLSARAHPGGEEIYVCQGVFSDDTASYAVGTWIRNPSHFRQSMVSPYGCTLWVKRGHLSV
jgi:anti-sigma factor ChrR (cupin superfamily)